MSAEHEKGPAAGPAHPESSSDPEVLPTWSPAALSLGATLMVWGLVSSLILTLVGGIVFAAALVGWVWEMCHGAKHR